MSEHVFLGRLIGVGKLAFVSIAIVIPGVDDNPDKAELLMEPVRPGGPGVNIPLTCHRFFERMLRRYANRENIDSADITSLTMRQHSFTRDPDSQHFRILLTGILSDQRLSCTVKSKIQQKEDGGFADAELPFGATLTKKGKSISLKTSTGKSVKKHRPLDEDLGSSGGDADASESARSWGTESVENAGSEDDTPSESEGEEQWKLGIKSWNLAPSGRAACHVCDQRINKGSHRFVYRFIVSKFPWREKYVHIDCVEGLPLSSRDRDKRKLRDWLVDEDLPAPAYDALSKALAKLSG